MTIGEKIKARRTELMLSQRDLCEKMGYSNHSTIGKIEAGKVDIPQSRIVQFAEVLGVSVAYLMGWDEEEKEQPINLDGLSEKRKALIDFAMSVPEDKAEMILQVMKTILKND
jgi:transcriptional regulator with XRE-family HTH domain